MAENRSSERDIAPRMFLRTHDFFTKNASLLKPDVTAHTCRLSNEETGRKATSSEPACATCYKFINKCKEGRQAGRKEGGRKEGADREGT